MPPNDDPLAAVLGLGNRFRGVGLAVGLAGATIVHGAAAARGLSALLDLADYAAFVRTIAIDRIRAELDVDLVKDQPKVEAPEPEEPEPDPPPLDRAPPNAPPPTPAEAGKVLSAEADPDAPVDMTGWDIPQGESSTYAGGETSSKGTSKTAVHQKPSLENGKPGGTGTKAAPAGPPKPDLTSAPKLSGGAWNCGFPPEADLEQINSADAYIVVTVGPTGEAKNVAVTTDPGFGFGRLARACAMRKRFTPGLDRDGRAITKTLGPIKVRFRR